MSMSSNVPPSQARSAPLSPPQSALDQVVEDSEEDTVEDQDLGAMAPPGGRGGLLTLPVAQDMPEVEDAAEEDHLQGMEDHHQAMEDQALVMEDPALVMEDQALVMEDQEDVSLFPASSAALSTSSDAPMCRDRGERLTWDDMGVTRVDLMRQYFYASGVGLCRRGSAPLCPGRSANRSGPILSQSSMTSQYILAGEPAAVPDCAPAEVLQCPQPAVQPAVQTHRLVQCLQLGLNVLYDPAE